MIFLHYVFPLIFVISIMLVGLASCNKVAHTMAKTTLNFEEILVWLEDCPLDVLPLVLMDKSLIE